MSETTENEINDCQCDGDSYFESNTELCSTCHYPTKSEYARQERKLGGDVIYNGGGRFTCVDPGVYFYNKPKEEE
jgi:hypothetical protein